MLLSEAIQLFLDSRIGIVAPETLRWYKRRLRSLNDVLGGKEAQIITTADLRSWRKALVERDSRWGDHPNKLTKPGGLSPATLHGHWRACRALFKWLHEEELIETNPARRLQAPPLPREPRKEISPEDALKIIEAARDSARDHALLRFLAVTGCRIGGVAGLRLDNISLEPDADGIYRAVVYEKGRGGERKARIVYFDEETAHALRAYIAERPTTPTDHLFLTEQLGRPVRPLQREGIYRMIERYAKQTGVKGQWNPHAWRHRFAHGLIENGADLGAVQQLMGHTTLRITVEFYGQRDDRRLAAEHARHSWLTQQTKARD